MRLKIDRPVYGKHEKKFFAYLPINIGYEWRWLEWVNVEYEYSHYTSGDEWRALRFIDKEPPCTSG